MLKLIKDSLLNPIQVSAEVNAALKDNSLVVVTRKATVGSNPVYSIYGCQGEMVAGEIHKFADLNHDTREEEGRQ